MMSIFNLVLTLDSYNGEVKGEKGMEHRRVVVSVHFKRAKLITFSVSMLNYLGS